MNDESRGITVAGLSNLHKLLAGTGLATASIDQNGRLRGFTPVAAEWFGLSEADLGQPLAALDGPLADAGLDEDIQSILQDGGTLERELSDPTGHWYLAQAGPWRGPQGIEGVVLNLLDITRRKRDEQALNETLERSVETRTEQVRRLASSLAMAEHYERARVGRVLHDSLQQLLYGIQLKVALLAEEAVSAGQTQLSTYADEARRWIGVAVDTTRQLSVDLSPPLLQDDKLADGLEWLKTQMAELYQLEVELAVDNEIRLPDEGLRVLLFQTVRELLVNVVRHAGTERAMVTAHEEEGDHGRLLAIEIRDHGRGFDPAVLEPEDQLRSGFGLARLRGRLDLFGGRLEVDARPGAGSRLTVYLPHSILRLAPPTGERSS